MDRPEDATPRSDAPGPAIVRLEVVSRVGCVWCDRLKDRLATLRGEVTWFESACLDPAADGYAARRDELLARALGRQRTFPFVFDADSGTLIGGYEATMDYISIHRLGTLADMTEPDF